MPTARSEALLAVAVVLATLVSAEDADAYCRTSACGDTNGQLCTPPSAADCGKPLFWGRPCFGFSVQQDASEQVDLATAETLVAQAFASWTTAPCPGGGTPFIGVANLGPVSCDQPEYNQQGGNTNVVIFRDGVWPYAGQGRTLALTTVTYNLETGEIFDADLEVNSTSDTQLSTGDQDVKFDLLSILTHETGHMLGLAHSRVEGTTMTLEYFPGDLDLRDLHPDDIEGICAIYPPAEPVNSCDPTPRHGFKTTCGDGPSDDSGCGCRSVPGGGHGRWLPTTLLLAGCLAMARRRRR